MEIYTIITTFLIISYEITITCLIYDGNTHILNFQIGFNLLLFNKNSYNFYLNYSILGGNTHTYCNFSYNFIQDYYNLFCCDGNTHILNFQTILYVVTLAVISPICSENILNFQY